jgi:hypothetical protein
MVKWAILGNPPLDFAISLEEPPCSPELPPSLLWLRLSLPSAMIGPLASLELVLSDRLSTLAFLDLPPLWSNQCFGDWALNQVPICATSPRFLCPFLPTHPLVPCQITPQRKQNFRSFSYWKAITPWSHIGKMSSPHRVGGL